MRLWTTAGIAVLALVGGQANAANAVSDFKNRPLVAQRYAAWTNSRLVPGLMPVQPTRCSPNPFGRGIHCTEKVRFLSDGELVYTQTTLRRLDSHRARVSYVAQGTKGFLQSSTYVLRSSKLRLTDW